MSNIVLKLSLSAVDVEMLLLWMPKASDTTWADRSTRKAMQNFAERIKYAVRVNCPEITMLLVSIDKLTMEERAVAARYIACAMAVKKHNAVSEQQPASSSIADTLLEEYNENDEGKDAAFWDVG